MRNKGGAFRYVNVLRPIARKSYGILSINKPLEIFRPVFRLSAVGFVILFVLIMEIEL